MSLVSAADVAAIRRRQAAETAVAPLSDPAAPDRHRHVSHAAWRRSWTVGLTHLTRRIDVLRTRDDGVQVAANILHRALDLMSASVGAALDGEAQAPGRITAWADEIAERTWKDMSDWNQRCLDEAAGGLLARLQNAERALAAAQAEVAELRAGKGGRDMAEPKTALERAWQHVHGDWMTEVPPDPAEMVRELRAWVREWYPELVEQVRKGGVFYLVGISHNEVFTHILFKNAAEAGA